MTRWIAGLLAVLGLVLAMACQHQAPGRTGLAGLAWLPVGSSGRTASGSGADPAVGGAGGVGGAGSGGSDTGNAGLARPPVYGYLDISIKWPKDSIRDFKAQLIPQSTNRIDVIVRNQLTTVVASVSVERPSAAQTAATASLKVLAGSVGVEAQAFRVVAGTPTAIAQANAVQVTVVGNARSLAKLTLGPLFAPTITGLSPQAARDGDAVTITGTNLGAFESPFGGTRIPDVFFNGTKATTVTALDATSLQAVVPAGATVGGVSIVHDGATSSSTAIFYTAQGLAAAASAKAAWDETPADSRMVLFGGTVGFTASASWSVKAGDSLGNYPAPPGVIWEVDNGAAGTIDADGQFLAGSQYATANVTCRYGSRRSNAFTVRSEDVWVSLSPAEGAVGPAGDSQVAFTALNVFSSGATSGLVAYAVDDSSVSISAAGIATATDSYNVGYGGATVTATSQILGSRNATASLEIANWLVSTVPILYLSGPRQLAFGQDGTLFLTDMYNSLIRQFDSETNGTFAGIYPPVAHSDGPRLEAGLRQPTGLTVLPDGNLVWYDYDSKRLRHADLTTGWVATHAGSAQGWTDGATESATLGLIYYLAAGHDGTVYMADRMCIRTLRGDQIATFAGTCHQQSFSDGTGSEARFNYQSGMDFDEGQENLYVADGGNRRIRKIDMVTRYVGTIAGNGATPSVDAVGTDAQFTGPYDVKFDGAGNLWIADTYRIRRMSPDGTVKTITGQAVEETAGYQDGIGAFAKFKGAYYLAIAPDGAVYVTDMVDNRVRKIVKVP